jgi:hypothetical protein
VCRPGGTIGLLCWTPEGMIGELFRTMKPFMPPPPPGTQPPPLWGSEAHLRELLGDRVEYRRLERETLIATAFATPQEFADHFITRYGPSIAARANAARDGRAEAFDAAILELAQNSNRGTDGGAVYEMEYLLAVATRL